VALNPVIKFTTLFGLLAVALAVKIRDTQGVAVTSGLAVLFCLVAAFFLWNSFYGMRIRKTAA
jgi:K(+)-stimulated pyrophosphate-energized sodium pump